MNIEENQEGALSLSILQEKQDIIKSAWCKFLVLSGTRNLKDRE